MKPIALVVALVTLAVTGCLGDDEPAPDVPTASTERLEDPGLDFSEVAVADHGAPFLHTVRQLHEGSHLLELVGYNDMTDKLPPEAYGTGWAALGIWENYACITQWLGTGSLGIVDIADPANPTVMSQTSDALVNGDCQFTADGRFMFAGAYLGAVDDNPAEGTPYLGKGAPGGYGMNVWDISDKSNPVHVLFSDTGEYHTHHLYTDAAGQVWVVQAYSGNIYRFHEDPADMELMATVTPMSHDMWIQHHPITDQPLLFSGAGSGFVIYDFSDPGNLTEGDTLAIWQAPDDVPRAEGWHRQALSSVLIDGKAIAVVSGETCGSGETRPYLVIDVTDVTNPITMGSWELPGTPVRTDPQHLCEFSSHEFSLFDGYLAVANYHAGVWLIDIGSAERLMEPVTLGYYIPNEEPLLQGRPQDLTWPWNPFVWGAEFDSRGYVLAGDFSSGLYVFEIPGISGMS